MEKIEPKLRFLSAGELKVGGYTGEIIDYTVSDQLLDEKTWKLFVDQFRIHSDTNNEWRGEFWGKMMRGGALTYIATKNEKLYAVLTASVKDLLSVAEPDGRVSTYPREKEFNGWDMWCRKYVMLGLLYYYDICKSEALKRKIVYFLKRHADYIIKHVGKGRGKKDIFKTSDFWGAMNSCSILEPFVKLYVITEKQKYFDFAKYIVDSGCCEGWDLIEESIKMQKNPFEFPHVKAYEMMSCMEGVLEYYKVVKDPKYLRAVQNFFDMVAKTDYTIIGGSGCTHELFDNSTERQTEYFEGIIQETCVTVTFIKLCAKLLLLTGDSKYVYYIERSGYNGLFGAVNNERQTMEKVKGMAWKDGVLYYPEHESFPFDSYSPIYKTKRGKGVGGFQLLQNGRSYGCCACIGSAGTAIVGLTAVCKDNNGFYVNLYNALKVKSEIGGQSVKLTVVANPYKNANAKIRVEGNKKEFSINLRLPEWAEKFEVLLNGEKRDIKVDNGYVTIKRTWGDDTIEIKCAAPVVAVLKNGKIAFTKGAIVLASDQRIADIDNVYEKKVKNGKPVRSCAAFNARFRSNVCVEVDFGAKPSLLCDYAQAGKNYDEDDCVITVWHDIK